MRAVKAVAVTASPMATSAPLKVSRTYLGSTGITELRPR